MTVELFDLDVMYTVRTNVNDEGKDFIEIAAEKAPDEYHICLGEPELDELILTLQFMKKVLRHYGK